MALENPEATITLPKMLTFIRFSKNTLDGCTTRLQVDNHKKNAYGCMDCGAVCFDYLQHCIFHSRIEHRECQPYIDNEYIDKSTNREEILALG